MSIKDSPKRARLAWGIAIAAMVIAAAAFGVTLVNLGKLYSITHASVIEITMGFTFALVGGVIASRHPENPIGWLFLFMSFIEATVGLGYQYAWLATYTHPGLPGANWAQWWADTPGILVFPFGAAPLTFLLLPDGNFLSRRWKILGRIVVVYTTLFLVLAVFAPDPILGENGGIPTLVNPVAIKWFPSLVNGPLGLGFIVGLVIALICAAGLIVRLRRSQGEQREQLRWITYVIFATAFLSVAGSVVGTIPQLSSSSTYILLAINLFGWAIALPIATAIAIFKYRLYDIDTVISRTLIYGALAIFITAVYVGIAVGVGALVGSGGKPNLALSIVATAIVAFGFQPVREQMQRIANRLIYGERATPYEVLSEFADQVAATDAAEDVLPRMARVLQEGTGAELAVVWLRNDDGLHAAAVYPTQPSPQHSVPVDTNDGFDIPDASRAVAVRYQGELLGALSIRNRRGESLTGIEQKLVDDLAHQSGLVLKNVGLTQELLRRLEELRASRQRLVTAQDHERRRLERNLHDGAQQHLVALKVKLGLAQMLSTRDPDRAKATVSELKNDADEALETLRELARGIYPPLLADKGLAVALESQARKATLPVTVKADGLSRYSQDVEAAVYFCVLEALQNIQKYAQASQVVVHLSDNDNAISFEVTDDGIGFDRATAKKGAGLTNMGDRLDALGGSLDLKSTPGEGTVLLGAVPVVPLEVAV